MYVTIIQLEPISKMCDHFARSSTSKMPKLSGRTLWLEFELWYLHLCVWVYNDFVISSIYQNKKNVWPLWFKSI